MESTISTIVFLGCSTCLFWLYVRYTRASIAHIPGPEPESLFLGNYRELFQSPAGEADFRWQARYGDIVRLTGPLGAGRLLVTDPKAVHYIFQTSGYNFLKQPERRELSRLISGRGLLWADGDVHKRQKKILLPVFSTPIVKACTPIFFTHASKLAEQWREKINASADETSVIDITPYLSRAALDSIGKMAFDYEFGTLDHADNALGNAYMNLALDTFGAPTEGEIFVQDFLGYIPQFIRALIVDHAPSPKLRHVRSTAILGTRVAEEFVASKKEALVNGKEGTDILSLVVKSNASKNENARLTEEELLAQIRTILSAGHETTANTLSWMLLEASRKPDIQRRLRREIRSMERIIRVRGDTEFTLADLNAMTYLNAFIKESLRFHPVGLILYRQAVKDDVLPLSKPIITTTGKQLSALPIPKGLRVMTSISSYNRNKELFGEDSHTFDPERWLDSRVQTSNNVGVVGNLMSFSSGVRSCIGWKFAMAEMQAFLVELVGSFEFELTPDAQKVRRESAIVMVPLIEGQSDKGGQLPLRVRIALREEDPA